MTQEELDEAIAGVIKRMSNLEPGSRAHKDALDELKTLKELKVTNVSEQQLELEKVKVDNTNNLEQERNAIDDKNGKRQLLGNVLKVVGTIIGVAGGLFGLHMTISAEDDDDKILPSSRVNCARNIMPRS